MATDESYQGMYYAYGDNKREAFDLYDALYSRSNEREMFISTLDKIPSQYNLDSAKSCLALGPNDGYREVGFVEKCTANATKFIAIEEGREASERLKVHLRKRLPDVDGLVIEGDFRSWKGPSDPVDLVLAFHCLYPQYFKDGDDRRSLLRKVHDRWLIAGGFMAVLVEGGWCSNSHGRVADLYDRLGCPTTPWKGTEDDILDVGFIKKYEYEFQYTRDYSNPDEAFLRFYESRVGYTCTLDDIRRAMKELYEDGKTYEGAHTFVLFQKAL